MTDLSPPPAEVTDGMLPAVAGYALPSHPRTPIKRGQIYRFKGYPGAGFKIQFVALPGHEEDDGGLSGVAVKWLNLRRQSMFYAFGSEADFWACDLFRNACDPEFA
jgi:hypothetical protein